MPTYDPLPVIGASLDELRFIASLVIQYEQQDSPRTVLIGGWAVHSYNAWYGSIDIDLITDAKGKKRLIDRLVNERGFERFRMGDDLRGLRKNVANNQWVIIDLGTRGKHDPFEGTGYYLDYTLLDGNVEWREVTRGAVLPVPERTTLLVLKAKAAWDRNYRLRNGTSPDSAWEWGKLHKDRGDILALLDPTKGGKDVRIDRLAKLLEGWPFLWECIVGALRDPAAVRSYGWLTAKEAEGLATGLGGLLGR